MDDPDPDYWLKPCKECPADIRHSNLECVTRVAENVGMSVEEAKKVFVPQGVIALNTVNDKWVNWSSKHKVDTE